jgi:hypothetical protein
LSRPLTFATYGRENTGILTLAAIFRVVAAVCIVQTPAFVLAILNALFTCKADMQAEGKG